MTKLKIGMRVRVKSVNNSNNAPDILKEGYVGIITKIKTLSILYEGRRWINVDGYGGIIEDNLEIIDKNFNWRKKYEAV